MWWALGARCVCSCDALTTCVPNAPHCARRVPRSLSRGCAQQFMIENPECICPFPSPSSFVLPACGHPAARPPAAGPLGSDSALPVSLLAATPGHR